MSKKIVSILHPYLESRRQEIEVGLYPKNHLWGIDALENSKKFDVNFIIKDKIRIPTLLEKLLDRSIFRNSPGTKAELSAYFALKKSDFIYSVCGPLGITKLFPNKVLAWTFKIPSPSLKKSIQLSYSENNLRKSAGFFCLTPRAANYFNQFATSIFIPWCVDMDLFNGKTDTDDEFPEPFFLATGKTERDYGTLIKSAHKVAAEIRIIAPNYQKPSQLPSNINWVNSSSDPRIKRLTTQPFANGILNARLFASL